MKKALFSASSQPFIRRLGSQTAPGPSPGEKRRSVSDETSLDIPTSRPVSFEMRYLLVAGLLLTWISVGGAAQRESTNPHTTPEDVAAGGRIYRSHCIECHGRDGTGGRGPDITRGDLRYGNSDAALADTISTGIPGTSMPLFFFNGKQLWQIVAFVQSIRREEPQPPGDPAAGAAIFRGKGGCVTCHMVDGQGGRQGAGSDNRRRQALASPPAERRPGAQPMGSSPRLEDSGQDKGRCAGGRSSAQRRHSLSSTAGLRRQTHLAGQERPGKLSDHQVVLNAALCRSIESKRAG